MKPIKYKPKVHLPIAVKELGTLSSVKIVEWILDRFNVKRDPDSVGKFFKRNPDVREELEIWLIEKGTIPPDAPADPSMFIKGAFEVIKSVDEWMKLKRRDVGEKGKAKREKYIRASMRALMRFCIGIFPGMDARTQLAMKIYKRKGYEKKDFKRIDLKEHGWVLKHPDRVKPEDGHLFLDLMNKHYPLVDTSGIRIPLRDFLISKGYTERDIRGISGDKHKSAGTYAKMSAPIEIVWEILDYVKARDKKIYVADHFMFLTGTRISATLTALLEDIYDIEGNWFITVYDKGDAKKYGDKGHPWEKPIPLQLMDEIMDLTGYPTKNYGLIFEGLTRVECSNLNKEAINEVYPELFKRYPTFGNWNHFFRHLFGQHYLKATGWNFGIVAMIGGWDVKSLEESYGKADVTEMLKWSAQIVPQLTRKSS